MARAQKLYYDVILAAPVPSATIAPTLDPDRDGGLLDSPPALDGNAAESDRQNRELSVFFEQNSSSPDLAFVLTGATPDGDDVGQAGYAFRRTLVNSSYVGPLVLHFTAPVDPESLSYALDLSPGTPPFPPPGPQSFHGFYLPLFLPSLSVAVVGSTIEISNAGGNQWGSALTGTDYVIWVILTSALRDVSGRPLFNPGRAAFWNFLP